jgi:preprotein translocase subunit SecB
MKARVSPLELQAYFVTAIGCTANSEFDPEKPTHIAIEELAIEAHMPPRSGGEDKDSAWKVLLTLRQNLPPERNAPYNFHIVLQGWFAVLADSPEDQSAQLVETTGGSILYGVAREILRSTMAAGPYLPMLLPSVSFHPMAPEIPDPARPVGAHRDEPIPTSKKRSRRRGESPTARA